MACAVLYSGWNTYEAWGFDGITHTRGGPMNMEELARLAEKHRERLVRLTVVRGHDPDTAEDIVQEAVIAWMGKVPYSTAPTNAVEELKRLAWSFSGAELGAAKTRQRHVTRIDDTDEEELHESIAHDDNAVQRDCKIDVGRALQDLSEDDRELARLVWIEGFTHLQALSLFSDTFSSETALRNHLNGYIKPRLQEILHDYAPKGGA
jgi:DNA-directed RNA polymerase specialized sigma24 family protein